MALVTNTPDDAGEPGWLLEEDLFDVAAQGKCETLMAIGNGYLGCRAATEEDYIWQKRNTFVAGTFNRFHESEVTELPNVPDTQGMQLWFGDDRFSLDCGSLLAYRRTLNLRTGEVSRCIEWCSPSGLRIQLTFRRFASLANLHLIGSLASIKVLSSASDLGETIPLRISFGIDGQQTNSGVQHFVEGERRIRDRDLLEYFCETTQSGISVLLQVSFQAFIDGQKVALNPKPVMSRRRVGFDVAYELPLEGTLTLERQAQIHSSRDVDIGGLPLDDMRDVKARSLRSTLRSGYDAALRDSVEKWSSLWRQSDVVVHGNAFDQLAVRFSIYHIHLATPKHDPSCGIAAKSLTGEGYKGHSFWDSELFVLPHYLYCDPAVARSLLTYRYLTLEGARENARSQGYRGARFAWESASTGLEVTPMWGDVDIHTGSATRIWSGELEQHITADIAYAIWRYEQVSGDQSFMKEMGFEMVFEAANYWCSRLEWLDDRELWGLRDVVGPDEYKEHVDNNAFTNHMVSKSLEIAISYYQYLADSQEEILLGLQHRHGSILNVDEWRSKFNKMYLPRPRPKDLVLPQDDSYLTYPDADIDRFKSGDSVGSIFHEYNLDEINRLQVCKQADVIALLWAFPSLFTTPTKRANWDYYEPRTLHDSSLSPAVHVCVAASLDMRDEAYQMYQKASRVDLGEHLHSSDEGIHVASLGGLWQATVLGFGGLHIDGTALVVRPMVPDGWSALEYPFIWRGRRFRVFASSGSVSLYEERIGGLQLISSEETECVVTLEALNCD